MLNLFKKNIIRLLAFLILNALTAFESFAQGPAGPPGGSGGASRVGVPLDSNAIFLLVGAGIIYLVYHYRHLFLKKESLNEH